MRSTEHERYLEDSWMLTMPSFLGFEGINPLTVHFCYRVGGVFWVVVLEVSIHHATVLFFILIYGRFITRSVSGMLMY